MRPIYISPRVPVTAIKRNVIKYEHIFRVTHAVSRRQEHELLWRRDRLKSTMCLHAAGKRNGLNSSTCGVSDTRQPILTSRRDCRSHDVFLIDVDVEAREQLAVVYLDAVAGKTVQSV